MKPFKVRVTGFVGELLIIALIFAFLAALEAVSKVNRHIQHVTPAISSGPSYSE